jgi:hypothetical protein
MAPNLPEEIAAKVSMLPPERQREALSLIEQLAARHASGVAPAALEAQVEGRNSRGSVDQ